MKFFPAAVLFNAAIVFAQAPPAAPPAPPEYKGIPARATPGDYQFQTKVGAATIAAEFTSHSFPTAEGPLTSEDYVAVEVALYGAAGERLKISSGDFSLRVNGKKTVPSQVFSSVFSSLRDPEYIEPDYEPKSEKGSKTSMNSGGGGGKQKDGSNGPPPPVKIPVPIMRAMAQRIQKAALPEGDRALPQAGLIFFGYRGKTTNLQSVELLYDGPAGKITLELHK